MKGLFADGADQVHFFPSAQGTEINQTLSFGGKIKEKENKVGETADFFSGSGVETHSTAS